MRETVADVFNQLLNVVGINTHIEITNYQIVNETITAVEDEGKAVINALNAMNPTLVAKVLETMTPNEIRAMAALPPLSENNTPTL